MSEWLRLSAQLTPRVWDTGHHLLHYRPRQLSAILMTKMWAGDIGLMIPQHKSSQEIWLSCLLSTLMTLSCELWQMTDVCSAVRRVSWIHSTLLLTRDHVSHYCVKMSLNFFLVSWILYLECRITNSTKEYFLFSQHQPED